MSAPVASGLDFTVPATALATTPAEQRGIPRDGVRMLVARPGRLEHHVAADLPEVLRPGDVLVVNDSRTLPASVIGRTGDGEVVDVHFSTVHPEAGIAPAQALSAVSSDWIVELRRPRLIGSKASYTDRTGTVVTLPSGGLLRVHGSNPPGHRSSRLWHATVSTPRPLESYLAAAGDPIRYNYVAQPWSITAYRTVFGTVPGSAEMPSAARPLTWRVLQRLADNGIQVEYLTLHCGVSSLESGDPPYSEWFSVPEKTAAAVNSAHADGRRVIAVGTTVVRALESASDGGRVEARSGWTDLMITPGYRAATVEGMLTGWHEPEATHLAMLEAVAGRDLLKASYREALEHGYLWHEFGDVHLLLP
ncbi:MAG TPA: S-adenosylmethionine:tRNA ribosyltransferase-isomerase [Mycobacteriales bacterium]|nr:S-adenosylmethionine:tRNA ribosyltransferase-isomerase [Mycobacteriales bacterium]